MGPETPVWDPDMVVMSAGISGPARFREWHLDVVRLHFEVEGLEAP